MSAVPLFSLFISFCPYCHERNGFPRETTRGSLSFCPVLRARSPGSQRMDPLILIVCVCVRESERELTSTRDNRLRGSSEFESRARVSIAIRGRRIALRPDEYDREEKDSIEECPDAGHSLELELTARRCVRGATILLKLVIARDCMYAEL